MSELQGPWAAHLLPFQKEGVQFALSCRGRCMIADDMGLGKTLQAIATMWHFKDDWPLLVVCPSSVVWSWVDELEKWLSSELLPSDFNLIRSGTDVGRVSTAKITIVSYALFSQPLLLQVLTDAHFKAIILDESHYIKNRKAHRTISLLPILTQAIRVLLLSGTPALSRPEDLYTQLSVIAPYRFGSFTSYANRFCNAHNDHFGWNTKGASNLGELHQMLGSVMIRRLKKDVLTQLPPKRRQRILLDVSQSPCLQAIKDKFTQLGALGSSLGDPQETEREEQAPSLFDKNKIITELFTETCNAKVDSVCIYIRELCKGDTPKFLIFAYHRSMMAAIQEVLVKEGVKHVSINGDTPVSFRRDAVHCFQTDNSCRVFLLSLTAASQGITLTAASHVVFAELHWTPGLLEQAEDRAHRIGQTSSVNVQYLVARGTLDDVLWSTLSRKINVLSQALNGCSTSLKAPKTTFTSPLSSKLGLDTSTKEKSNGIEEEETNHTSVSVDAEKSFGDLISEIRSTYSFAEDLAKSDIRSFFSKKRKVSTVVPWTCPTCTIYNSKNSESSGCELCHFKPSLSSPSANHDKDHSMVQEENLNNNSSSKPKVSLQYSVSAFTGRVWLFQSDGTPMHVSLLPEELFDPGVHADKLTPAMRRDVHTFLKKWNALRSVDQRLLSSKIVGKDLQHALQIARNSSAVPLVQQPGSTQRFTSPSSFERARQVMVEAIGSPLSSTPLLASTSLKTPSSSKDMSPPNIFSKGDSSPIQISEHGDLNGKSRSLPSVSSTSPLETHDNEAKNGFRRSCDLVVLLTDEESNQSTSSSVIFVPQGLLENSNSNIEPRPPETSKTSSFLANSNLKATDEKLASGFQDFENSFNLTPLKVHSKPAIDPSPPRRSPTLRTKSKLSSEQNMSPAPSLNDGDDIRGLRAEHLCLNCGSVLQHVHFPWDKQGAGKKQDFCSHECWEHFSIQTGNNGQIRRTLLELERGICQLCGLDVRDLFLKVAALFTPADRQAYLMKTPFSKLDHRRLESMCQEVKEGNFWQADHIAPVMVGGGESDIFNYRTLCTMCHERETSQLAPEKKKNRLAKCAKGTKDIRNFFLKS